MICFVILKEPNWKLKIESVMFERADTFFMLSIIHSGRRVHFKAVLYDKESTAVNSDWLCLDLFGGQLFSLL